MNLIEVLLVNPPGAASSGATRCPALTLIVRLDSTTLEQHLNLWCDRCALPSGYDCTYGVELHGSPCGVVRISGCVSCDLTERDLIWH